MIDSAKQGNSKNDLKEVDLLAAPSILNNLPTHWKRGALGEICQRNVEGLNPQAFPDEIFEYYSIPAFQEQGEPVQTKGKDILSSKLLVQQHTILFGKLNPRVLKVWLVRSESEKRKIASTEFIPLLPNDRMLPTFLYYLCQSSFIVPVAKKLVSGSTPSRQRVDIGAFYKIEIPFPPLPEPRAIAYVLQSVRNVIQARHREITLERERKAALMQHLFTHGMRNEATKQSEIGEIPESWDIVPLGSVCLSSAFGPRFSSTFYSASGNIATLRTTDIDDDGNINYSTMPLAQLDIKRFEDHLLQRGDFLVTRSGTCGVAAVFTSFEKPVLPGAFLIRFRFSQRLNPYFLRYYINSSAGKARISRLASGAIQKNLTGTALSNMAIPLPSLKEQEGIAEICNVCDTKIAALEKELSLHEELFHALLEELMTGRLSTVPLLEKEIYNERTVSGTETDDSVRHGGRMELRQA